MLVADVHKRGGDSVQERFGADEAVVGEHVGAIGKMLARAETDFEMSGRSSPNSPTAVLPASGTSSGGRSRSTSSCCPWRSLCPLDRP